MKRIKLIGSRKDKAECFYQIIQHGNAYSSIKNIFNIGDELFDILKQKGVKFKELE